MSKRDRGEGSISKRKDGLYAATISLGTDSTGKRIRKTRYASSAFAAKAALKTLKKNAEAGITGTSDTVSDFMLRWLEARKANLREATVACYHDTFARYIEPHIGNVPLTKVTPLTVQGLMAALSDKSARVRALTYAVLRSALKQAVQWRLLATNPTDGIERPRTEKKEMQVWTKEQVAAFLAGTLDNWNGSLYVVALMTGLRQGELLGLQWSDIEGNTLTVRQQLVEVGGQVVGLRPPKTAKGRRTISLSPNVLSALTRQKARLLSSGLAASTYVFPSNKGAPQKKADVLYAFQKASDNLGLPVIRFHDMRHTNATLLISSGVDAKTVQGRFGHSQISVTLDTYAKFVKAADEKAAAALEEMFA